MLVMCVCVNQSVAADEQIDDQQYYGQKVVAGVTQKFEMYNPHSPAELLALKEMGFTQVILDWPNLHQQATECGLNVVMANWWHQDTSDEEIERSLKLASEVDASRLVGISLMDEPERNTPDTPFSYYVDRYQQLRPRLDRTHPDTRLEISYWGPLKSWKAEQYRRFSQLYRAADVMRLMPYPDLHEAPLREVYLMMQRSRKVMQLAEREIPTVVILQTWVIPPDGELPRIAELRVMAYQAMLCGADVVSFFDFNQDVWDRSSGFREGFEGLISELTGLSALLSDAVVESVMDDSGVLSCRILWPSGKCTELRVNTNRFAVAGLQALSVAELREVGDRQSPYLLGRRHPAKCCQMGP
jgi:hypothetical protein